MPLPPGAAMVGLRDRVAVVIVAVGVDGAERADAARLGPMASRYPVGDGNARTTLDEREDFGAAILIALIACMISQIGLA